MGSSSGDSDYSGSDLETDFDVDICSNSNDESSGLDVTDPSLKKEIKDWRILKRKTRSERRIKLRIARISESAEVRRVRIEKRTLRRSKRRTLRLSRVGWTLIQWRKIKNRILRRRKWRIRRKNETERHWTLRVKRWRTRRINRRMGLRKEREGLNDDESSSDSNDDSESELETDLDVDIRSDSNDESSGLDISDTTLHKQIIDWRTKQRKLRSERRIKLRIVRQNETADQRKVRITWRIRRRTKRRKS